MQLTLGESESVWGVQPFGGVNFAIYLFSSLSLAMMMVSLSRACRAFLDHLHCKHVMAYCLGILLLGLYIVGVRHLRAITHLMKEL